MYCIVTLLTWQMPKVDCGHLLSWHKSHICMRSNTWKDSHIYCHDKLDILFIFNRGHLTMHTVVDEMFASLYVWASCHTSLSVFCVHSGICYVVRTILVHNMNLCHINSMNLVGLRLWMILCCLQTWYLTHLSSRLSVYPYCSLTMILNSHVDFFHPISIQTFVVILFCFPIGQNRQFN